MPDILMLHAGSSDLTCPSYLALSPADRAEVAAIWKSCCACHYRNHDACTCGLHNKAKLLIPHNSTYAYAAHLVLADFLSLSNKRWLNDEVLNALIELVKLEADPQGVPACQHAWFSTLSSTLSWLSFCLGKHQ